jgi:MYXO-CTERM domain-containing protein
VTGDQTEWATFDAAHPALDTAAHGLNFRPIYSGSEPVLVNVAGDAAAGGELPKLLLLHHTNVKGKRFEIVSLANGETGNVAVTATAPEGAAAGDTFTMDVVAENQGVSDAKDVKLSATASGAKIQSASAGQGSCSVSDGALSCDLGTLAASSSATVTVTLLAEDTVEDISARIDAKLTSGIGCETSLADNQSVTSVTITAKNGSRPTLSATGGCGGCRVGSRSSGRAGLFAALLALGLALLRRRRGC